jgi:hypothetical protein
VLNTIAPVNAMKTPFLISIPVQPKHVQSLRRASS